MSYYGKNEIITDVSLEPTRGVIDRNPVAFDDVTDGEIKFDIKHDDL